ncbi:UDP-glycosyltransferase UGT5-like [Toxorhynchites rutilus septentrionalis]|uniref:UDP-glycosyltransferase UGT5-like n=1 Tax=Toxorhynchites rutilus septentrionalis TaxID=329112 RepID=UPI002478E9EB|nr:UDP-glycosyltransferase UGT5-like [Toxorhynchites rutilus septentrionalis]
MKYLIILTCSFSLAVWGCHGSKIIAVFPSISKTNYIFGQVLFEELAARGHQLTVISPFEISYGSDNIRQIRLTGMVAHLADYEINQKPFTKWDKMDLCGDRNLIHGTAAMTDYTLGHPDVRKLLESDETFDLMILDHTMADSLLGLALHYRIPVIVYSSTGPNRFTNEMAACPHNPAYNPVSSLGYSDRMSLSERLWNTFASICEQLNYKYLYLPTQETIYRRHFPAAHFPPLLDLIHNVSLVLVNSHPVINYPRPLVPNMVEIGGAHLRRFEESGLSEDLIGWLEAAKKGVIYFSLGANTKSMDLPANVRRAFTGAFGQLPGTLIIWKWENITLENHTTNVILGPWMPQQELLAHPNVRLHITHGGSLGMMESVYHGKPILGLPFTGDQQTLVDRAVEFGYGLKLDYQNISEDVVLESIKRIMLDSKFRENALEASRLFRTQPIKPMDKAVHYIELVLNSPRGLNHLRSAALNLAFWERQLVDVVLCCIGILLLPVAVFAVVIQIILRKTHQRKSDAIRKSTMIKKTN